MRKSYLWMAMAICLASSTTHTLYAQNKVDNIIHQMTPQEKRSQMWGLPQTNNFTEKSALAEGLTGKGLMVTSGRNKKYGIPGLTFVDGPKGVSYHGKHVVFPAPVLRGCSFDKQLEYRMGQALALETSACGANYIGAVTLNLTTHPQCGQAELWYGEDPWLAARMGVQLTKGIQKDHHVMACAKHFAMFELETNKGEINAVVGDRALNEIYLIPFMKVVQDADLASMMTSYNKVNGTFTSENKMLLTDIARNRWGFKGFYTSDWGFGVYNGLNAIKAGNNIEMPNEIHFRADSLQTFMDKGQLSWNDIDNLIRPTIATKMKFTDNEARSLSKDEKSQLKSLSQEIAEKSMVLLKNEGQLPFDAHKMKHVLVVGELAKSGNLGEYHYVPSHNFSDVVTPLRGIRRYLRPYGVGVTYCSGNDLNELTMLAQDADAIIVCVGRTDFTQSQVSVNPDTMYPLAEYNGGDRQNLDLTVSEQNILRCANRMQKKMAVVYYGGSAVITKTWNRLAPSLIYGGFAGMNGGNALAKILFGETNPSGKLSFSIYEHESDYPAMPDNPFIKTTTKDDAYNPWVDPYDVNYDYYFGYMKADRDSIKVDYPFGFGLSYTNFALGQPTTDKTCYGENETITVSCDVTNTGNMKGGEVVQAYIGVDNSKVDRPKKALKDFSKLYLNVGEKQVAKMEIPVKDLAFWNTETNSWEIEKTQYTLYVGTSSSDKDLKTIKFDIK